MISILLSKAEHNSSHCPVIMVWVVRSSWALHSRERFTALRQRKGIEGEGKKGIEGEGKKGIEGEG
jgi:hypothetical protein